MMLDPPKETATGWALVRKRMMDGAGTVKRMVPGFRVDPANMNRVTFVSSKSQASSPGDSELRRQHSNSIEYTNTETEAFAELRDGIQVFGQESCSDTLETIKSFSVAPEAAAAWVVSGAGVPEVNGCYTSSLGLVHDDVPRYTNQHGSQLLRYRLNKSIWWYLTRTPVGEDLSIGHADCYRVNCSDDSPPCHLEWTTAACPSGVEPPPTLSKQTIDEAHDNIDTINRQSFQMGLNSETSENMTGSSIADPTSGSSTDCTNTSTIDTVVSKEESEEAAPDPTAPAEEAAEAEDPAAPAKEVAETVVWEWYAGDAWVPYDKDVNALLEQERIFGERTLRVNIRGQPYAIQVNGLDDSKLKQRNEESFKERPVRRQVVAEGAAVKASIVVPSEKCWEEGFVEVCGRGSEAYDLWIDCKSQMSIQDFLTMFLPEIAVKVSEMVHDLAKERESIGGMDLTPRTRERLIDEEQEKQENEAIMRSMEDMENVLSTGGAAQSTQGDQASSATTALTTALSTALSAGKGPAKENEDDVASIVQNAPQGVAQQATSNKQLTKQGSLDNLTSALELGKKISKALVVEEVEEPQMYEPNLYRSRYMGHRKTIRQCVISEQAHLVASVSEDGTGKIWDLTKETNDERGSDAVLDGKLRGISALQLDPESDPEKQSALAAAVHNWNSIEVVRLEPGNSQPSVVQHLGGHLGSIYSVIFSADSQYLASCASDSTISIWRVNNAREKDTEVVRMVCLGNNELGSQPYCPHSPVTSRLVVQVHTLQ